MSHGGDIFEKKIIYDFSVSLNPMGTPSEVMDVLKKSLEKITEYPDLKQRRLKKAISAAEGCTVDEVLGGNGSSGIFPAIAQMIKPETVLMISPCFSGYEYAVATINNCRIIYCPEREIETLPDRIDYYPDMVIIANPNNPTGQNIDEKLLLRIVEKCEEAGSCIVVDECFLPLSNCQHSLASLATGCRNLFVVKAFTKSFAIPGIRIGYVISSAENIDKLAAYIPEWDLSVPAIEAGIACAGIMKNTDFLKRSCLLVKKERDYLEKNLSEQGFEVKPSDTCYIMFRGRYDLYDRLLDKGILVRECSDFRGLNKGWYRIAIKDHEANLKMINIIKSLTEKDMIDKEHNGGVQRKEGKA